MRNQFELLMMAAHTFAHSYNHRWWK